MPEQIISSAQYLEFMEIELNFPVSYQNIYIQSHANTQVECSEQCVWLEVKNLKCANSYPVTQGKTYY